MPSNFTESSLHNSELPTTANISSSSKPDTSRSHFDAFRVIKLSQNQSTGKVSQVQYWLLPHLYHCCAAIVWRDVISKIKNIEGTEKVI